MFKFVGGWEKLERYPLIQERFDVIRPYVVNKTVLDCGPGGEEVKPEEEWWQNLFLHKKINEVAKECVGVDNDQPTINKLNSMGYDIQYGDVESLNMDRRFDVVVAGEFIEHLSNPGKFLECAKAHLALGGKLILTTPNAWALGNIVRSVFGRKIIINKGHVLWYDKVMLEQLLERHGYKLEKFYWQQRVFRRATHLVKWFPHWALNFIVVATVSGEN